VSKIDKSKLIFSEFGEKLVRSLDKSNMYAMIDGLGEQIRQAYFETKIHDIDFVDASLISDIVICGMGGSAISADIAQALYGHQIRISVVKDHTPPFIGKNTLFIAISYSGNTVETLSCLEIAKAKTKNVIAITSGGKLREIAEGNHTLVEVPSGYPPRAAIGYLFFSLHRVLEMYGIATDQTEIVNKTIIAINRRFDGQHNDDLVARGLALEIHPRVPVIYSTTTVAYPVAYRWKCQINENAKHPAFCHSLPEAFHNEIEAWENEDLSDQFVPVFLGFDDESILHMTSLNKFRKILGENRVEMKSMRAVDIFNFFMMIYLGDLVSFYIAILNKVDPTEIDYIKKVKS
jgi:glucose/mannose-6-phosphate isomerase